MHIRRIVTTAALVAGLTVGAATPAFATNPDEWRPGDRLIINATGQEGRVSRDGHFVTWEGGSPTHRNNNVVTVATAAEMGARKIG